MLKLKLSIISTATSVLLLSGCGTLLKPVTTELKPPRLDLNIAKVLLGDGSNLSDVTMMKGRQQLVVINALAAEVSQSNVGNVAKEKKEVLGALMIKASDEACFNFLTQISTTEKTLRSGLGISSLLLSAAASVTSPVRSANLLSGISTAASGVEDELSTSILGGLDGDLLVQAVRNGRKVQRGKLANLLEGYTDKNNKPVKASFNRFLMEFSTYHDSCGISYGRQVLRNAVNAASATKGDE